MLKYIKCNLCGSKDYKVLYKSTISHHNHQKGYEYLATLDDFSGYHQIVKCQVCGLVYANPREDSEDLISQYQKVVDQTYLEEDVGRRITFQKSLEKIEQYKSPGRLLDVGCAVGFLLDIASKKGWEVFGIEPSQWARNYAKKNFGLEIFEGTLEEANFSPAYFDVLTFVDVLEHMADPRKNLVEANRILKKGGILYIVTPNINSFLARMLRRKWWFIRRAHLYYFSLETMKKMLEKIGFKIIETATFGRRFTLSYLLSKLENHNPPIANLLSSLVNRVGLGKRMVRINLRDHMEVLAQKKEGE